MSARTVKTAMIVIGFAIVQPVSAGYYTTIDTPQETRWSRDYKGVFSAVLINLGSIAGNESKVDSPIRHRYVLMDTLAREGSPNLKTLEQKLNFSAVLIRRGKAYEATALLGPLTRHKATEDNFLVWSHFATAQFLSKNEDFRRQAADNLKQALELWPTRWEDVADEQKQFLLSMGIEETAFDRFRRYETYLERLMRHRLREETRRKKGLPVVETLDPIFRDEESKEKNPVRFLNEDGKFEAGHIAKAEKEKLPLDAVEAVEQLLIWMPTDQRLLWLLGEVFNACAMEYKDDDERNDMVRSALLIFQKMDDPLSRPVYGFEEIRSHREALQKVVSSLPPPRLLNPRQLGLDKADPDPTLTGMDWWRTLGVGFLTGLAIGMFAVWQWQEVRRRRQARATASH